MGGEDLEDLIDDVPATLYFSEYERRAYLTVLEHGSLPASGLADRTDIPQPRIYDTVRGLEGRGLVEVHETRPMRVVAIEPRKALEELVNDTADLVDQLQSAYTSPDPSQEAVALIKSRMTILRNVERIIDGAEFELALALPPVTLKRFESNLRSARADGVPTEVIVSPAEHVPEVEEFPYDAIATSVRERRGHTTPLIAIADGVESVYATPDAIKPNGEGYGVLFQRSYLGFLLYGFYGTVLWTTADPVYDSAGAASLPRTFASVRRCIREIQEIDDTLFALIEGRWVDSDRSCTIDGEIVDTTLPETGHKATLSIATDDGVLTVGGRLAAYEDIEAHQIRLGREIPSS